MFLLRILSLEWPSRNSHSGFIEVTVPQLSMVRTPFVELFTTDSENFFSASSSSMSLEFSMITLA